MKKGLAAHAVIVWIVAIFVLVGGIYFIFQLDLMGLSDDQVCKASVLARATTLDVVDDAIPLKCTTDKVCLRDGRDECDESFAGETIRKINLDSCPGGNCKASDSAREFEAVAAEEMLRCWQMMGEGKLDLFSGLGEKSGLTTSQSSCFVCSRIALDVDGEESKVLNLVDMPTYLQGHFIPDGSETYLQAFSDRSVNAYAKVSNDEFKSVVEDKGKLDPDKAENVLVVNAPRPEYAIVFSQIKTTDFDIALENIADLGGTVAGSSFIMGAIIPGGSAAAGAAGRLLLTPYGLLAAAGAAAGGTAYVAYNTYESKEVAAGYCGDVIAPNAEGSRLENLNLDKGCSLVQVVQYNGDLMNKLCNHPEGFA